MLAGETRRDVAYRLTFSKMAKKMEGTGVSLEDIGIIVHRMEQAIYDHCVLKAHETAMQQRGPVVFPSWADHRFCLEYVTLWRHIHLNLMIEENNLRFRLFKDKTVSPEALPTLDNAELYQGLDREYNELVSAKDALRQAKFDGKMVEKSDGLIKCFKCVRDLGPTFAYNVEYTELQTRASDEPMTRFCVCLNCGQRWKM